MSLKPCFVLGEGLETNLVRAYNIHIPLFFLYVNWCVLVQSKVIHTRRTRKSKCNQQEHMSCGGRSCFSLCSVDKVGDLLAQPEYAFWEWKV